MGMSAEQKFSWCFLVLFAVALLGFLAVVPFAGRKAVAVFGLTGLAGLYPLFLKRNRGGRKVVVDERDKLIQERADLAALRGFWVLFLLACMIPWFINRAYRGRASVPVDDLPLCVFAAMTVFWLLRSITVLVQYGRGAKHVADES